MTIKELKKIMVQYKGEVEERKATKKASTT